MTTTQIITPAYDRAALRPRILHLGFGGFARAHPMVFLDEGLAARGGDWGAVVARLHSGAEGLQALREADHLYHVAEADGDRITIRRIGAVVGTLHPLSDGIDAIPDLMATAALALVTATITEKGYCAVNGRLDRDHPGMIGDLASPTRPGTAIGVLVEGLARRRAAGLGGLTILSCDNLPENGALTRGVVLDFARARDADLAAWIERQVRFPNSMVDRIVPAMGEEGHRILREGLGRDDPNGILCEPFRQWVIEDDFCAGRPDWDRAGATFTRDVHDYEVMKIRILNGGHQVISNPGELLAVPTIAGCMAHEKIRALYRKVEAEEIAPHVKPVPGMTPKAYVRLIEERFSNPEIKDTTRRVAFDGSSRHPGFILPSVRDGLKAGTPVAGLALVEALWARMCAGRREDGSEIAANDPFWSELQTVAREAKETPQAWLEMRQTYGDLADEPRFATAFTTWVRMIWEQGTEAAIDSYLAQ